MTAQKWLMDFRYTWVAGRPVLTDPDGLGPDYERMEAKGLIDTSGQESLDLLDPGDLDD